MESPLEGRIRQWGESWKEVSEGEDASVMAARAERTSAFLPHNRDCKKNRIAENIEGAVKEVKGSAECRNHGKYAQVAYKHAWLRLDRALGGGR
jgi:hypothetical protein